MDSLEEAVDFLLKGGDLFVALGLAKRFIEENSSKDVDPYTILKMELAKRKDSTGIIGMINQFSEIENLEKEVLFDSRKLREKHKDLQKRSKQLINRPFWFQLFVVLSLFLIIPALLLIGSLEIAFLLFVFFILGGTWSITTYFINKKKERKKRLIMDEIFVLETKIEENESKKRKLNKNPLIIINNSKINSENRHVVNKTTIGDGNTIRNSFTKN